MSEEAQADLQHRIDVALAIEMARAAKAQSDDLVTKVAIHDHMLDQQSRALAELTEGNRETLLAVTGMASDLKWMRDELSKKVDETILNAAIAREQADKAREEAKDAKKAEADAKKAKETGNMARLVSIIAMLVAILAGVLGVSGIGS